MFTKAASKHATASITNRERPNGCEKLQWFFSSLCSIVNWFSVIIMFLRPDRPIFLSSIATNPEELRCWEIIPFAIIQSYLFRTFSALMLFVLMPMLPGVFAGLSVLKELTISSRPSKRLAKASIRLPGNRATTYREFQVLLSTVHDTCAYILPGHKVPFILLAIRTVYMMVKFPGLSRLMAAIVAGTLWIYLSFVFTLIARFYEYSKETLFSWRRHGGIRKGQWFPKFRRSCRAIKLEIGGLYYVDYGIVITMFSIIIDYSVNLLLTYK